MAYIEPSGSGYRPWQGARYAYDAQGNRLRKATYAPAKGTDEGAYAESGTVHLRDAAGEVLATYRTQHAYRAGGGGTAEGEGGGSEEPRAESGAESGAELDVAYLAEVPLYGSRRVGLRRYATNGRVVLDNRAAVDAPPAKPTDGWRYVRRAAPVRAERERGGGVYEVSNHLSNVLATVADYRATVAGGAFSGVAKLAGVRGYVPGAREEHDYYPFGLPVLDAERGTVQRDVASLSYRYSFNGKEDDASLAGAGVAQDYGFRLYNKASARFMSTDPLTSHYPFFSPYQFAGNMPTIATDVDGLEHDVQNGVLVGYRVIAGQGPSQIAEDINNPKTKLKYGYALSRTVSWTEIIDGRYSQQYFKSITGPDRYRLKNPDYRSNGDLRASNYIPLPLLANDPYNSSKPVDLSGGPQDVYDEASRIIVRAYDFGDELLSTDLVDISFGDRQIDAGGNHQSVGKAFERTTGFTNTYSAVLKNADAQKFRVQVWQTGPHDRVLGPFVGVANDVHLSDPRPGDAQASDGFPYTVTVVSVYNGINSPTVLSIGFATKQERDDYWRKIETQAATGVPNQEIESNEPARP